MIMLVSMFHRYIVGFLISVYVTDYVVNGDVISPSSVLDSRRLQTNQTLTYRATYKADFQHVHDFQCSLSETPTLRVTCYGATLKVLNRSDSTILCEPEEIPDVINGTTHQCINTCTDCSSVYESSNLREPFYGSIEFMCEGNEHWQVDALYTFVAGSDGSCTSVDASTQSRNYHLAWLGVSCPTGTTGRREYVYDDTFVDCRFGLSSSLGNSLNLEEENIYTCVTGDDCKGLSCVVPFDEIFMYATLPSYLDSCVESLVDITPSPTLSPQISSKQYIVQFEASWAFVYDVETSQATCASSNPSVLITCGAGTSINFVNSTGISTICVPLSSSELSCTISDTSSIVNNYVSVFYTCAGSNIPVSKITYPDFSILCTGNSVDVLVGHSVGMGVYCFDATDTDSDPYFYYRGDLVFECAETRHSFAFKSPQYGIDTYAYFCNEYVTFGAGSTSRQTVSNVTIITQDGWLAATERCVNLVSAPTSPTAPIPVATNTPTSRSSINPSVSPTKFPTTAQATELPSRKPFATTGTEAPIGTKSIDSNNSPTEQNGSQSLVGVAIGAAVGGVALAAVIGFLVFWSKRRKPSDGTNKPGNASAYNHSHHPYTESNTDHDFSSSQSPPPSSYGFTGYSATASPVQMSSSMPPSNMPLPPITEVSSNAFNTSEFSERSNNKREVFVPTPDESPPTPMRTSNTTSRSAYPTNHVVDVKDQCRSVAMIRSSSPTFVSQGDRGNSNIPFAVALGVSTTSSAMASVVSSTSSKNSKKEPSGRIMTDL